MQLLHIIEYNFDFNKNIFIVYFLPCVQYGLSKYHQKSNKMLQKFHQQQSLACQAFSGHDYTLLNKILVLTKL